MPLSTQDLQDIIMNDAVRLGNDPALMLALADQESGFNPNALSPKAVRGLFQVTNDTGKPYGQTPQTRTDPRVSSDVGQRHFKDLLFKAGGDVPTALTWYNGGSDPQFAQKVLAKVSRHTAARAPEPSLDDLHRAVYGDPAAAPATGGLNPQYDTPDKRPGEDLPLEESLNPIDLALTGGMAHVGTRVARDLAARVMLSKAATNVVRPLVTGVGAEGGYKLSQLTGNAPGAVTDVGLPDVVNVALPGALDAGLAGGRQLLRVTRAGRALSAADAETARRFAAYEDDVAAHARATQDALDSAQRTQADKLAEAEALQADRVAADKAKHQTARAEAGATYTRQMDDYGNATAAHRTAADRAGTVVTDAQPLTPSWVLYQKVRDAAPDALVDYAPVSQIAQELASAPGAEYLPPRVLERLTRLHTADPTGTVATAHEELKFWGPLTNSKNGTLRGTAKQIHGALQDTLEQGAAEMPATAGAVDLLRDARGAFRKEKALEDVQRIVQASGTTGDDGVFRYRPGNVVTQIDKLAANDPLFRGSFAPGELDAIRADFMDLTGIPKVPTTRPTLTEVGPAPTTPVPRTLTSLRTTQPSDLTLPGVPDRPALPGAAAPTPAPSLFSMGKHLLAELGGGGGLSYLMRDVPLLGKLPAYAGATAAAIDAGDALLSRYLLGGPVRRAWLKRQMAADGSVSLSALHKGTIANRAATGGGGSGQEVQFLPVVTGEGALDWQR